MNNKRSLSMEVKAISDTGTFEGVLATYGNVDLGGDVIESGAFTKTIQENGPEVKLLWQHEPAAVIGKLLLFDGPDALRVKGQIELDPDIPYSMTAYKLLRKQLLSGLSIGYDTVKETVTDGVRHLKELRLWEGSIVTFPMNELAGVTSVKSRRPDGSKDSFTEEYAENVITSAPFQMLDAIAESLLSLLWTGGLSADEIAVAAAGALQQFTDAWLAWLPQYQEMTSTDDDAMGYMRRSALELKTRLIAGERKEGRRFSDSTMKTLAECHSHVKSVVDHGKSADSLFVALFNPEADEDAGGNDDVQDTSDGKAAHHLIFKIRSLIPSA